MARFDDEIWETVPAAAGDPPAHLAEFVRGLGAARHALDLGCGDGRLTALVGATELTAADVSQVALDRARARIGERARLVRVEPDAELPFADGEFDLALCAETVEHVRDVQLLLSELRRVLAPGGRLAVTTPAALPLIRPEHPFSPHIRFFTRGSLRAALAATGFEPISLRRRRGSLLALAQR